MARLERWMADYRSAWESNDPGDIRALFTEDAEYYTAPFAEPWVGHEGIVAGWLGAADGQGETSFQWSTVVENDDLAVVSAQTTYADGPTYSNLWIIRFGPDGRAIEYTEWWMDQSEKD